jgi:hypothetical protein
MKKLLLCTLAAASMAACNSSSDNKDTVKDSVVTAIDSTGDARVDSVQNATDSLKEKTQKSFEKTDSANKVIADSAAKTK